MDPEYCFCSICRRSWSSFIPPPIPTESRISKRYAPPSSSPISAWENITLAYPIQLLIYNLGEYRTTHFDNLPRTSSTSPGVLSIHFLRHILRSYPNLPVERAKSNKAQGILSTANFFIQQLSLPPSFPYTIDYIKLFLEEVVKAQLEVLTGSWESEMDVDAVSELKKRNRDLVDDSFEVMKARKRSKRSKEVEEKILKSMLDI